MKITAIRSDRIYRDMMTALPDKKENIYRNQLMKPFEFKWACVGIPLTAAQEGGYDVVSAATMSGFYAPVQITEERQAEIEKSAAILFGQAVRPASVIRFLTLSSTAFNSRSRSMCLRSC